jgi:hypothetical protein
MRKHASGRGGAYPSGSAGSGDPVTRLPTQFLGWEKRVGTAPPLGFGETSTIKGNLSLDARVLGTTFTSRFVPGREEGRWPRVAALSWATWVGSGAMRQCGGPTRTRTLLLPHNANPLNYMICTDSHRKAPLTTTESKHDTLGVQSRYPWCRAQISWSLPSCGTAHRDAAAKSSYDATTQAL